MLEYAKCEAVVTEKPRFPTKYKEKHVQTIQFVRSTENCRGLEAACVSQKKHNAESLFPPVDDVFY